MAKFKELRNKLTHSIRGVSKAIKKARRDVRLRPETIKAAAKAIQATAKAAQSEFQAPPLMKKFLESNGDEMVRTMKIVRTPVNKLITQFLNVISLGVFKKLQKKEGVDKFFHLKVVVNDEYVLEKNQTLNIGGKFKPTDQDESLEVPIDESRYLTIQQMVDNTKARMGPNFGPYDALKNNCQDFIMNLLISNELNNEENTAFVKQPIDNLVKELPGYVGETARTVTDLGGLADLVAQQFGVAL